jgi:DNA-binding transcriptional LysR family regulator
MMLATRHLDMLLASALAGLGVAALPSFMVKRAFLRNDLVHVLPQWRGPQLTLYAAVPSRTQMPARTRVLLDYLAANIDSTAEDAWWPQ